MEPVNIRESKIVFIIIIFLFLTFKYGEHVVHYFKYKNLINKVETLE